MYYYIFWSPIPKIFDISLTENDVGASLSDGGFLVVNRKGWGMRLTRKNHRQIKDIEEVCFNSKHFIVDNIGNDRHHQYMYNDQVDISWNRHLYIYSKVTLFWKRLLYISSDDILERIFVYFIRRWWKGYLYISLCDEIFERTFVYILHSDNILERTEQTCCFFQR